MDGDRHLPPSSMPHPQTQGKEGEKNPNPSIHRTCVISPVSIFLWGSSATTLEVAMIFTGSGDEVGGGGRGSWVPKVRLEFRIFRLGIQRAPSCSSSFFPPSNLAKLTRYVTTSQYFLCERSAPSCASQHVGRGCLTHFIFTG